MCVMAKSQEDIDRETNQERHDAAEQRGAAGLDHVAPYMDAVGLDDRQQAANDAAQAGHDNGVNQAK